MRSMHWHVLIPTGFAILSKSALYYGASHRASEVVYPVVRKPEE